MSFRTAVRRALLAGSILSAALVIPLSGAAPAGALPPDVPGPVAPTDPVVRGSVDQVYVLNADPGTAILIDGVATGEMVNPSGAGLVRGVGRATTRTVTVTITVGDTPQQHTGVTVFPADQAGRPNVPQRDVFLAAFDANDDNQVEDHEVSQFATDAGGALREQGYLEVSDGTLLSYRVDLPPGTIPPGGFPTLILYSGYRPSLVPGEEWDDVVFEKFVAEGFAVVGVNMRGTGCSGGAFDVMEPLVGRDGYDIVETVARQDWVAGDRVGLVGASWPGLSQLWVAQHQPPRLAALAPGAVIADFYRDIVYPGGVQERHFIVDWWGKERDKNNKVGGQYSSVPGPIHDGGDFGDQCDRVRSLRHENRSIETDFTDPANATRTDYWADRIADVSTITAPTLLVQSWHDEQTASRAASIIDRFPDGTMARMLAVPAFHGAYTSDEVLPDVVEFLHAYLDGTAQDRAAQVDRPVVDARLAEGRSVALDQLEPEYAPAVHDFVLGEGGAPGQRLIPELADAATSSFRYEVGAQGFATGRLTRDVANFTSEPLGAPVLMAGPGSVDLSIRTDAARPDLEVNLIEVRPDGREMLISSGWLKATHGLTADEGTPFRPDLRHTNVPATFPADTWTEVRAELFPFAHEFSEESRIKLQVGGVQGGGQPFWSPIGVPDAGKHVTIGHGLDEGAVRASTAVLPVRTDAQVVNDQGDPAGDPSLATCVEDVEPQFEFLRNWWYPCRPSAQIEDVTASVNGTSVTLDWSLVHDAAYVAELVGPVLTDSGEVTYTSLVPAQGPWTITAPPGRHRYTIRHVNGTGVTASGTSGVVDVAGFAPRRMHLPSQPAAPLPITWTDTADHYWANIDGNPLQGLQPLASNQVSIPANRLTRTGTGGPHLVTVTACRTGKSCDSVTEVRAGHGGSVTVHKAAWAEVTGRQDGSSLVATVTGADGRITRYYAPVGGVVIETAGATVETGGLLARILGPSRDVLAITVG